MKRAFVDVSAAHDIFVMFYGAGRNVVMTFLRGMYKDPRWVGVSADVTIPVMVSAVRYFLLTFGTCNLKRSAAVPPRFRQGPPAQISFPSQQYDLAATISCLLQCKNSVEPHTQQPHLALHA